MTPREQVDLELQIIANVFNVRKVVDPMVIFIKDDKRSMVLAEFRNDIHKDILSQGIKELVAKSMPDIVVYTAEAWMTFEKNYKPGETIRPAYHPNRVEIIVARIEFKTGEKFDCHAKILRSKGEATLDKFEVMPGGMSMGRFVDFYPISKTN